MENKESVTSQKDIQSQVQSKFYAFNQKLIPIMTQFSKHTAGNIWSINAIFHTSLLTCRSASIGIESNTASMYVTNTSTYGDLRGPSPFLLQLLTKLTQGPR